jgi:hypothetical protein
MKSTGTFFSFLSCYPATWLGWVTYYYPYLATGVTLGKEQETKVRWKKILRVIAKKKLLFFAQHTAGIEST